MSSESESDFEQGENQETEEEDDGLSNGEQNAEDANGQAANGAKEETVTWEELVIEFHIQLMSK